MYSYRNIHTVVVLSLIASYSAESIVNGSNRDLRLLGLDRRCNIASERNNFLRELIVVGTPQGNENKKFRVNRPIGGNDDVRGKICEWKLDQYSINCHISSPFLLNQNAYQINNKECTDYWQSWKTCSSDLTAKIPFNKSDKITLDGDFCFRSILIPAEFNNELDTRNKFLQIGFNKHIIDTSKASLDESNECVRFNKGYSLKIDLACATDYLAKVQINKAEPGSYQKCFMFEKGENNLSSYTATHKQGYKVINYDSCEKYIVPRGQEKEALNFVISAIASLSSEIPVIGSKVGKSLTLLKQVLAA